MPKFNANLTMLFNEVEFLDRFEKAANNGFSAVEYLFPYDWPVDQLVEVLGTYGLKQVLHNLPAGDWAGGERGIACIPGREQEFQDGVGRAVEYAKALTCPRLNCLVGHQALANHCNSLKSSMGMNRKAWYLFSMVHPPSIF